MLDAPSKTRSHAHLMLADVFRGESISPERIPEGIQVRSSHGVRFHIAVGGSKAGQMPAPLFMRPRFPMAFDPRQEQRRQRRNRERHAWAG